MPTAEEITASFGVVAEVLKPVIDKGVTITFGPPPPSPNQGGTQAAAAAGGNASIAITTGPNGSNGPAQQSSGPHAHGVSGNLNVQQQPTAPHGVNGSINVQQQLTAPHGGNSNAQQPPDSTASRFARFNSSFADGRPRAVPRVSPRAAPRKMSVLTVNMTPSYSGYSSKRPFETDKSSVSDRQGGYQGGSSSKRRQESGVKKEKLGAIHEDAKDDDGSDEDGIDDGGIGGMRGVGMRKAGSSSRGGGGGSSAKTTCSRFLLRTIVGYNDLAWSCRTLKRVALISIP